MHIDEILPSCFNALIKRHAMIEISYILQEKEKRNEK